MKIAPQPAPAALTPELPREESASRPRSQSAPEVPPEGNSSDRVELVRAQNLLSPQTEGLEWRQALKLLNQVAHSLLKYGRQEMRLLHQEERLRDLCLQLKEELDPWPAPAAAPQEKP